MIKRKNDQLLRRSKAIYVAAVPVSAKRQSISDAVPSDSWAYRAPDQLRTAGIINSHQMVNFKVSWGTLLTKLRNGSNDCERHG